MSQPDLEPSPSMSPRVPARRAARRLAFSALAGLGACAPIPPDAGPLPVRNQHPAQLTVLHLDPVPARTLGAGGAVVRLDAGYSSLWLAGQGAGNSFRMDGEILRAALDLRVGLGAGLELECELPAGYASGGGLDGFVTDWHDFWGFPDQGRSDFARDDYEVRAASNGSTVFAVEPHELQWMDVPVGLRMEFLRSGPAALAGRVAVELPTGDDEAGFGNGEFDVGVGLIGDLRWPGFGVFAHAHHTFAGTPDPARAAGVEFRDVTALGCGLEVQPLEGLALHLQTQFETSTLRALGFERVADPHWLLWAGFRVALGDRSTVEFAIGEDLNTYVSPDFTIWMGVATRLGPP